MEQAGFFSNCSNNIHGHGFNLFKIYCPNNFGPNLSSSIASSSKFLVQSKNHHKLNWKCQVSPLQCLYKKKHFKILTGSLQWDNVFIYLNTILRTVDVLALTLNHVFRLNNWTSNLCLFDVYWMAPHLDLMIINW